MSVKVGARDDLHAAIFAVNVINRQPHGHCLGGSERPVRTVLVPRDALGVAWQLTEVVRRPANDVRTDEVLDIVQDRRRGRQVPDGAEPILVAVNRVTALPFANESVQQPVGAFTRRLSLGFPEDAKPGQVTLFIVGLYLLPGQLLRAWVGDREEAEVAVKLSDFDIVLTHVDK